MPDTGGENDLGHVRWIGGGSGAGKTTLARRLAGRSGLRLYSTDATISAHSRRLSQAEAPLLATFRSMSVDERWLQQEPATMYRTFPWFHGEGFDLVIEDLRELPRDKIILVEGFGCCRISCVPGWRTRARDLADPDAGLPAGRLREARRRRRVLAARERSAACLDESARA